MDRSTELRAWSLSDLAVKELNVNEKCAIKSGGVISGS